MILSHQHKFIFMHCRKTAGSSCAAYFNRFLGPNDVQLGAWQESLQNGGAYNRRFYTDVFSRDGIGILSELVIRNLLKFRIPKPAVYMQRTQKELYRRVFQDSPAHPSAETIAKWAPEAWGRYFKFGFIRNPYEQVVSDYRWRTRSKRQLSFTEFLERLHDPMRSDPEGVIPQTPRNWEIITIDNSIALDFVGRKERLEEDMSYICNQIGIPFEWSAFPLAKKASEAVDYRTFYGEHEFTLASRIFQKEIDSFGYTFEGAQTLSS